MLITLHTLLVLFFTCCCCLSDE